MTFNQMKITQQIAVLTLILGTTGLATSQTTEVIQTPMERSNLSDTDDDSGKWGLAGLLGLLGLLGLRRDRDGDNRTGSTNMR